MLHTPAQAQPAITINWAFLDTAVLLLPPQMRLRVSAAMATEKFLPFLEPAEESALLAAAPVKAYAAGEVVFDRNVVMRAIFVVDDGAVRVERQDGNHVATLAVLGPGEFFGEMSFVDGAPTSARVVANAPTRLRMIDTTIVDNLSEVDPSFGSRLFRSIAAILVERLRLTSMDLLIQKPWV
jgi:extracellular factor (EF) 3-hydroxypalmitic acid methyl ester biosynthesis protein